MHQRRWNDNNKNQGCKSRIKMWNKIKNEGSIHMKTKTERHKQNHGFWGKITGSGKQRGDGICPTSSNWTMRVTLWPCSAVSFPSAVTIRSPRGAFPGHFCGLAVYCSLTPSVQLLETTFRYLCGEKKKSSNCNPAHYNMGDSQLLKLDPLPSPKGYPLLPS